MGKIAVGDVFLIPISGNQYGIGQVAGNWKGELYVLVYDEVVSQNATPADVDNAGLKFAVLTLDAKFHHGDWPVIGNRTDNLERLPQPWFAVGVDGKSFVEARDRSVLRPATAIEEVRLKLRTVVAPIRLEKALQASMGVGEWLPHYDELYATYAIESAALSGNS